MIKVKFVDFWPGFNEEEFLLYKILKRKCNVVLSEDPDFIFYSVFGYDFLKYDCVRICFIGENVRPDFNLCDYAVGFDWLSFQDRYYRLPLYRIYEDDWDRVVNKTVDCENELSKKKAFCNFIYSNGHANPIRENFYKLLAKYKFVHSGGKLLNNIGFIVNNKWQFQRNFKFTLAFENATTLGYTTEKILQAMSAYTIPIYWGNTAISKEFNEKSFINCHAFHNADEVIEKVREVDSDDRKWCEMMQEPWFVNNCVPRYLEEEKIALYFAKILGQSVQNARRRERFGATLNYEVSITNFLKAGRNYHA